MKKSKVLEEINRQIDILESRGIKPKEVFVGEQEYEELKTIDTFKESNRNIILNRIYGLHLYIVNNFEGVRIF